MWARSGFPEVVIGIDDTDLPGIGGTGRLARHLALEMERRGFGRPKGVTRHQLHQGPGVPKTSHNSSAAIVFSETVAPPALLEAAIACVERQSIPGSDPGVAMLAAPVPAAALQFAIGAQRGLVTQEQARRIAASADIDLIGVGGSQEGVIGALSAIALRADGNDGRFVDLPGIREVTGWITVADLRRKTGIDRVIDIESGKPLDGEIRLDVGTWVRPRLMKSRAVLVARRKKGTWVNADTRTA